MKSHEHSKKERAFFREITEGKQKHVRYNFSVKTRDYIHIYILNEKYFVKTAHIEVYYFHMIFREITKNPLSVIIA